MTETAQQPMTLTGFLRRESAQFARRLFGITLLVSVFALPAVVAILVAVPEAIDYLVVALGAMVVLVTGAFDRGVKEMDDDENHEVDSDPLVTMGVVYAILAVPTSVVLILSALGAHYIAIAGYPFIALVFTFALPTVDKELSGLDARLSPGSVSSRAVIYALGMLAAVYHLPSGLRETATRQRRRFY